MKKTILMMACCLFAAFQGFSNTITFLNYTNCNFTYSLRGLATPPTGSSYYESPMVTIPTGTTFYASPAAVPGMSSLPATATFNFIKGYSLSTPTTCDGSVGGTGWGVPQSLNTATQNCFPTCNNSAAYTVTWNTNSAGNVVVLIF